MLDYMEFRAIEYWIVLTHHTCQLSRFGRDPPDFGPYLPLISLPPYFLPISGKFTCHINIVFLELGN